MSDDITELAQEQLAFQEQIRNEREALDMEREEMRVRHDLDKEILGSKYRLLQIRCKHSRARRYTDYGRYIGTYCPDCKKDTG